MKLGEPITNANGVTLMPSGIRLTPMFIARIRKWNIDFIEVYVDKKTDAGGGSPAEPEAAAPESRPAAGEGAAAASRGTAARLSGEQQDFARSVAMDISRPFANLKENPLMMELRAVVIKRLIQHGPAGMLNAMRRSAEEPGREPANGS